MSAKRSAPYVEYGFIRTQNGVRRIWYGFEPEPERGESWKQFGTKTGLKNFLQRRYDTQRAEQLIKDMQPL